MSEKCLVVQTGGTIDKDYPRNIGGYAFEISSPATERIFGRAKLADDVEVVSACRKDSQELTKDDRENISKICKDTSHYRILITHGTDTILQTAEFLDSHVSGKIIAITGSFRPEVFRDSDADFNVGMAYGSLRTLNSPGVYVVLQGNVGLWNKFGRNMETGKYYMTDEKRAQIH